MKRSDDIIQGLDELMLYLDVQTKFVAKNFLKAGLPAFCLNNRWYSSKRAIDEYFYRMSVASAKRRHNPSDD